MRRTISPVCLVLGLLGVGSACLLACSSSSGNGGGTGGGDSGTEQDSTASSDTGSNQEDSSSGDSGEQPESGPVDSGSPPVDSGSFDASEAGVACATDAGMGVCGSTCVDLQSSTANCGACGHDCLGGACTTGQCQPIVLSNLPVGGTPGQIAVDGTHVGFTLTGLASASGGAYTVNTTGTFQLPTAVDSTAGTTYSGPIAMAGGSVYYFAASGGTTYMGQATAGTSASGANLGTLAGITGYGVTASPSGTTVAFGGYNPTNKTVYVLVCTVGTVTCHLEGSEVNMNGLAGIASDGTNAYYTSGGGVRWVPLAGGTPNVFLGGGTADQEIAIGGTSGYVYWADNGNQSFQRSTVPTASQSMVLDNSAAGPCTGLAADAKYIYYTDTLSAVVYTKADGTGTPAALARGNTPTSVAIDSKALYFIDSAAATVNKVALPQ
jgi:hypothetical protein